MVIRERLKGIDASSRAQWSDWKAERAYNKRLYGKYSPARLFSEALAYSVLLAIVRWAMRILFLQAYPAWVSVGSMITAVASIGFGAVAAFAAFAHASTVCNIFRGSAGDIFAPPPSSEQTAPETSRIQHDGDTSGRPPAIPSFILELIVPRRDRATLIGDLEEGYTQDLLPKYGQSAAAFWYWVRCMREVLFYGWPLMKKAVPWGIIIAAASTANLSWITEMLQRITK